MRVPVKCRVIWENITNRFLLFNIPTDIPLAEVAKDLMAANNINIFEMRRFSRLNSPREVSPVLVTILGNSLPNEIKLWFSLHKIRQFIDRPRQCRKCHKYNHSESKCPSQANPICVNCGTQHEGVCQAAPHCCNCEGNHRADYNQCPTRQEEAKFLKYKCLNFLSITDARRKYFRKPPGETYASTVITRPSDSEPIKQFFEKRTNAVVKILLDAISQQNKKILEPINALSDLLLRFMSQLNDSSEPSPPPDTEKRKKPYRPADLNRH